MTRDKCHSRIKEQIEYWNSMKKKLAPFIKYPNNVITSCLREEVSPAVMVNKYYSLDYLYTAYNTSDLEFWEALDNMLDDIEKLDQEAISLISAEGIDHLRYHPSHPLNALKDKLSKIKFDNYYTKK